MTPRRRFFLLFGCLLAVVAAELLGTPRNAGPDEPAHVVRGAGLVRGELFGERLAAWLADNPGVELDAGGADIANADPDSEALRVFDVPRWVTEPSEECFAGEPGLPASCATVVETDGSGAISTAATYPVWAHLLPGVATLVVDGPAALWLARLLHALLPVALLAAVLAHVLAQGRRFVASATLLALTPMVLFLLAVVNPSGVVMAGAVAMWVAVDDGYRDGRPGRASWLLPAGFAALVLPRDDGLLWAAAIVAVSWLVWRRSPVLLWWAMSVPGRVVVAVTAAVGAAWAVLAGGELVPVDRPATGVEFAELVIARTGRHLREAVGVVGWLDTQIPESAFALWCCGVGIVVAIALVADDRRRVGGAVAALGLFVVSGWVLEIVQGRTAGLFWQGRYALPMLMGVVLVAAMTPGLDARLGAMARAAPAVVAVVVWNLSFWQQLRRWGVGEGGSIRPWAWDTWGAPLPIELLIAVHLAASVGLARIVTSGSPIVAGPVGTLGADARQ